MVKEDTWNWEKESELVKAKKAKAEGDDSQIPDDWYCNAAIIVRGKKKDIRNLVEKIIPEMTTNEEIDFEVKVVYVRMSHGRFDIFPLNGELRRRVAPQEDEKKVRAK